MKNLTASIETVANYWNSQPCNLKHSDKLVGTEEYFDEVERRRRMVEPHSESFAEFDKWKGRRVLEIGTGIGSDSVRFAQAEADYTGVEISKKSLDLTSQRFAVYGLSGRFFLWNAENLNRLLPGEKFDLVYSWGVIHHTPNPQAVVDSVMEFLLPDSEFRLMLYAANSWKAIMIGSGLDQFEAKDGCPVARTFTRSEAELLLKRYQIISLEQDHIFPYVVEDYVQYRYIKQPWFQVMPGKMFRALERSLGWHLLIKAKTM